MKDLTITAIIKVYQYDELNEADRSLMKTAMEATARSYAPYSHFSVGARTAEQRNHCDGNQSGERSLPVGTLCGTYYPVLCQLAVSRPTGKYPRYRSKNRKGLYRNSYSSLWRLPPSDSGNGKTLRPAYPYSAIRQGMYLRSKKYRRFTTAVI